MKKKLVTLGLIAALIALPVVNSYGVLGFGDIVFDPTQFAQLLLDYAVQAEQLTQEVLAVEELVIQTGHWANALKNLDFTVLPIVGGAFGGLMEIYANAQEIFFNAAVIKEQFEELWSPFHGVKLDPDEYFAKGWDWNEAVREAHWVAMQQQAHMTISVDTSHLAMTQALQHSYAAVGPLQAAQAGNQLMGVQIAQQNETNALLASMAQAQGTEAMLQAAGRDQALQRLDGVMQGFSTMAPITGIAELPTSFR